jgi:DNA-binding XRE family transcriptional regulator
MMLIGTIAKQEGPWWSADCDIVGAFTQGRSRKEAAAMLAEVVELKVNRPGFKVTVTEVGPSGEQSFRVAIDASEPALLAAEVLKYQREMHNLSLADVAKALGVSSRNAYARYEQGKSEPSLSKFRELLAVVAPEMALTVGPRSGARPAPTKKPAPKRKAS